MKILVVSDTHGVVAPFLNYISKLEKTDIFVFLGDFASDGEQIKKRLGIPGHIIAGNGDWSSFYPKEIIVKVATKKLLLTHGHKYGVKNDLQRLYYYGLEKQVDGVLFGHTHMPVIRREGDLFMMNPGSPSFPRGGLTAGSYGVIEIEGGVIRGKVNILK